jgi:hypothetical protein
MKGDFTRLSFDSRKHFSRVLQQQGRVALDSDANEATTIVLHYLRTLSRDLFGAYGGPADGSGFGLAVDSSQSPAVLTIGAGHYYVDGILCEAEPGFDYADQPDYAPARPDASGAGGDPLLDWLESPDQNSKFWLYLDVWERHVSWIEDDSIREPALGGPDTCTRVQVIWQIRALPWDAAWDQTANRDPCGTPLGSLVGLGNASLSARIDPGLQVSDPCTISPEAHYRGASNQLYRVEIHHAGAVGVASFKWSRDNGSVATRWLSTAGDDLVVRNTRGFEAGDWIELTDDSLDLAGLAGPLVRIAAVQDSQRLTLDTSTVPAEGVPPIADAHFNPKVRRWDQRGNDDIVLEEGAILVEEASTTEPNWFTLEDGVQIQFAEGGEYRVGDYWLIPARVATQNIEWELDVNGNPMFLRPFGIDHHYAPLGIVAGSANGITVTRCTRCLEIPVVACRAPALAISPSTGAAVTPRVRTRVTPVTTKATTTRKGRGGKPK